MNKKLFFCAVALSATAQLYTQGKSYKFVNRRSGPVKILIEQTESMDGPAKPRLNFTVQPGMPHNTTAYFIQSITITGKDGKSYTWHSQQTGKGQQNVGDIRYWGADAKLNEGGVYYITEANDESKFTTDNKL